MLLVETSSSKALQLERVRGSNSHASSEVYIGRLVGLVKEKCGQIEITVNYICRIGGPQRNKET